MSVRLLVLGGQGMLGHKLWEVANAQGVEAWATVRRSSGVVMAPERAIELADVANFDALLPIVARVRPDVIVNCVGVVKQLPGAKDAIPSLTLNALLPHRLAALSRAAGARFVHISTDCVFSGRAGNYREDAMPDAEDLYGRSKLLGEVGAPALTLRTSIIGRELYGAHGLVEWFLAQTGRVQGYRRAIFSGLTTLELSRTILDVLTRHQELEGLYHVAAAPIDKHTLLTLIATAYGRQNPIAPVDAPAIDRSLDGARFVAETGRRAPAWERMIGEMAAENARYAEWRKS